MRQRQNITQQSSGNEGKDKLLARLDEILEDVGKTYGPVILEELKGRLQQTVEHFNEEVLAVLKDSFKKHWDEKRELNSAISSELQSETLVKDEKILQDKDEEVIPKFIQEHEKKTSQKKK